MSEDFFLDQPEIDLGVARRACPRCAQPLVIRLRFVTGEETSAAIRLGLVELTPQERSVFDGVYQHFPLAVTRDAIVRETLASSDHSLDRTVVRLRRKLVKRGWALLAVHATLRLVEPVPVEGAV